MLAIQNPTSAASVTVSSCKSKVVAVILHWSRSKTCGYTNGIPVQQPDVAQGRTRIKHVKFIMKIVSCRLILYFMDYHFTLG